VKQIAILALTVFALNSAQARGQDKLCSQLRAFEVAVAKTPEQRAEWIKVDWNFSDDAIFSIACTRRDTTGSRVFCSWVGRNVSMEFSGLLPQRVLNCYSVTPNPYTAYKFPAGEHSFRTPRRNTIVLQTGNYAGANGTPWMRLAIFPKGSKQTANDLPDLEPYQVESSE
jgi:hypothetical protein